MMRRVGICLKKSNQRSISNANVGTHYDIIIIGGGIMGSATAYELAKFGRKSLLIEQFNFGHNFGASHGDGRIARLSYSEMFYVNMMRRSYKSWDSVEKNSGIKVIERIGCLDFGQKDLYTIQELIKSSKKNNVYYEHLTSDQVTKRFPQFAIPSDHVVMFQPDGAVVFADNALRAFRSQVQESLENTEIESIQLGAGSNKHRVRTKNNEFTATTLVVTAGAWTNKVLNQVGLKTMPLKSTNEQVTYYPIPSEQEKNFNINKKLNEKSVMPAFVAHDANRNYEEGFYGIPHIPGGVEGIKVGQHLGGESIEELDPSQRSASVIERTRLNTDQFVQRCFPDLFNYYSSLSLHQKSKIPNIRCLYTCTPDHNFIMGPHPQNERVILGCGFSGHGFKFAPVVGEMLASYAMQATDKDAKGFDKDLLSLLSVPQWKPQRFT